MKKNEKKRTPLKTENKNSTQRILGNKKPELKSTPHNFREYTLRKIPFNLGCK